MRKLVFILIALIAAVTFIRAYDHSSEPPKSEAMQSIGRDN